MTSLHHTRTLGDDVIEPCTRTLKDITDPNECLKKCSEHGNECWTWGTVLPLRGCNLLGFPCTMSGYPVVLDGLYSGLCYGGKDSHGMLANATAVDVALDNRHLDHVSPQKQKQKQNQNQNQNQDKQPMPVTPPLPTPRFHVVNGTGPCKDGLATLSNSEECAAAFLALVGRLPKSPLPVFNPCCGPADNLPYGCTLRVGDNDFIYNSNVNSTDKYADESRAAVCGSSTDASTL